MNPAFQDIEIKSTQLPSKKARSHCTHLFVSCFQAEAAQSPVLNHAKMGMEDPSNSWNPSMHCQKEIQELTCSTLLTPKKHHGYTVQVQPLPDGGQIDQNLTELLHRFASLCLAHLLSGDPAGDRPDPNRESALKSGAVQNKESLPEINSGMDISDVDMCILYIYIHIIFSVFLHY